MIVGLGCDIVQIARLENNREALAKRILSKEEWEWFIQFENQRQLQFLAGRFAAKEALLKAMPQPIGLKEITIDSTCGTPKVSIEGYRISLSISHEKDYATSVAIVESV